MGGRTGAGLGGLSGPGRRGGGGGGGGGHGQGDDIDLYAVLDVYTDRQM